MRLIPALDIIDGKCVRLLNGNYQKMTIYSDDPLEMAKRFEAHGMQYLHLVDLDGAKSDRIINYKVLEKIASKTSLKIDFGGGIKSNEDLHIAFNSGASQITGGSIAVQNPKLFTDWLQLYGADKIILGADVIDEKIAISGWQEESEQTIIPFLQQYRDGGAEYVICTDISRDGTLTEPAFALYEKVLNTIPGIKLIASGGISDTEALFKLDALGCDAAIIGKAIYENRIMLDELEKLVG
ncbi:1-(5-phosphoribosyl)-5-[(5-phosphoribosylamino)methylideneamino]imidazole-4-carboxamide isomerase [Flavobacterium cerinum]|uniref:1-(5-phosphoribosyl)-5-[(5-phosphoribosylamino)methylideneamino] imidazole-4-carboxamide isomerase n=1 Tax=Flavobacterium cerinum TaxID=2502784 RepID=A0ABY5INW3_9FLAO|nr:1-(5-phosphoribosyl)-5-[(5-phosphoribosylamino)methylideneamino]imidazole-4-carboxamide isomerase [Flavobacterium cerinum]UUC44535.1 1-(5-phosphoribosyl)-5-[(5-phosphoribosylamino)methylideneamino]imidazole-4-carboxamide isomerase [Flavobacterium cerinum]